MTSGINYTPIIKEHVNFNDLINYECIVFQIDCISAGRPLGFNKKYNEFYNWLLTTFPYITDIYKSRTSHRKQQRKAIQNDIAQIGEIFDLSQQNTNWGEPLIYAIASRFSHSTEFKSKEFNDSLSILNEKLSDQKITKVALVY